MHMPRIFPSSLNNSKMLSLSHMSSFIYVFHCSLSFLVFKTSPGTGAVLSAILSCWEPSWDASWSEHTQVREMVDLLVQVAPQGPK